MRVQRAQVERKAAALSGEFGLKFLRSRFGNEVAEMILEHFGTYSRGPRKGLNRGYIVWDKCTEGGWRRTDTGGYVQRRGVMGVRVGLHRNPDDCWDDYLLRAPGPFQHSDWVDLETPEAERWPALAAELIAMAKERRDA